MKLLRQARWTIALPVLLAIALLAIASLDGRARAIRTGAILAWTGLTIAGLQIARRRLAGNGKIAYQDDGAKENEVDERVLTSLSEGLLIVDSEGRQRFANHRWRALFDGDGDTTVDGVGRQAVLDQVLTATLETGAPQRSQMELAGPGESRYILTGSPLPDSGGAVVLAVDTSAFHSLTEHRRDFVANVSHELKTPLSAIRGFAETLLDGAMEDPEAGKPFLQRIVKQCTRLDALLSDLLTLSTLEHASSRRPNEAVRLDAILREVLEMLGALATARNIQISTRLDRVSELHGDPVALERLCANLFENAVKYNRDGGRVDVRLFEKAGEVILEISDTGIGIPEAALDRLFERFYRVDKGRSRREGGTGLGLAIVKHATQMHGGRIDVHSQLGQGTTFTVRLPLAPGPRST